MSKCRAQLGVGPDRRCTALACTTNDADTAVVNLSNQNTKLSTVVLTKRSEEEVSVVQENYWYVEAELWGERVAFWCEGLPFMMLRRWAVVRFPTLSRCDDRRLISLGS